MQLGKQLILFRFILKQFGYDDFEALRNDFNSKEDGSGSPGRSFFTGKLFNRPEKLIDDSLLFIYDEAIQDYEKRLRENRGEPFLTLKYYQWVALLFTEYYLDHMVNHSLNLIANLNHYKRRNDQYAIFEDYTLADLKKIAFWMATGSGKTLMMHCNYWQILKYIKDWENIILITPNEGLSRQHYESMVESGIGAKLYSGNEEDIKTREGEILIIEITKLTKEKEGVGVSVDVDYFSEGKNLLFIDEGHKGQKSEERAWKGLREHITVGEGSFTFEYSATFGQIITNYRDDLLHEYGKSIIFDYSYKHFYIDGYGKDFSVINIDASNEYSDEQNKLLLTASLLGFYEQLQLFETHKAELRRFNIEKPLWVFVGSKVIGNHSSILTETDKLNVSDISRIIKFFAFALSNPDELDKYIVSILKEQSGINKSNGDDIFKSRFQSLKLTMPSASTITEKVFNGSGTIEAIQLKQAEGEIGLKVKTADQYFGVINIGQVSKYAGKLKEDTEGEMTLQEDNFTRSLFEAISLQASPINILIGSKKFIEGWNSWRVSSMGLMKMGRNEGAQIIQLFGRGVRLKGKDFSLKREQANAPYHIKALQTISIVGLNASYMNRFLEEIDQEFPEYKEYPIKVSFSNEENRSNNIASFRTEEDQDFKTQTVVLEFDPEIAKRVNVDLRHKISVTSYGFNSEEVKEMGSNNINFLKHYFKFINIQKLTLEANRYKLLKGYINLIISKKTVEEIINNDYYHLYSHPGQFGLGEAVIGKIQEVANFVIRDYMDKYYSNKEKLYYRNV